ncbi:DKNYY domain-containing protein [Mycobacterium sp. ITM-2016-00317]|uniref:DKNYY domain-containing protein n=1 Tax=Mycobacterium sp. ITM-2016-00317 TaxID=2099694 RepID=UPI00287F719D|nr:DKNYY domain-containing protein [Mycobacterium sp. ITM-2016-00317]WNG86894.1 DKNYY domain-containing protein [Mycobacterium sp. ITM-2016-00317]
MALAVVVALAVTAGTACSRGEPPPDSLIDDAGYHVRGSAVYYLNPFPGKAVRVEGAEADTFETLDRTYARDREHVYVNGHQLPGAHAETFRLLDRPGFSRDRNRVYRHDAPISTDPDNFELLADELARDGSRVYWLDGDVLSSEPAHFVIISDEDGYLYAKDGSAVFVNGNVIAGARPATFRVLQGAYSRDDHGAFHFDRPIPGADVDTFRVLQSPYATDAARVYWMGDVIADADPATFEVLNANFECSADRSRAFYRQTEIAGADPATFPAGRPVTGCSRTTISFAE